MFSTFAAKTVEYKSALFDKVGERVDEMKRRREIAKGGKPFKKKKGKRSGNPHSKPGPGRRRNTPLRKKVGVEKCPK